MPNGDYPVQFSVDYPHRPLNRLTTFFRIFTAIPILILLATIGGAAEPLEVGPQAPHARQVVLELGKLDLKLPFRAVRVAVSYTHLTLPTKA